MIHSGKIFGKAVIYNLSSDKEPVLVILWKESEKKKSQKIATSYLAKYSYVSHNNVSVNEGPHIHESGPMTV